MRASETGSSNAAAKGQDPENQLRELRAWCVHSGHVVFREYVEHQSGRKGADKYAQLPA